MYFQGIGKIICSRSGNIEQNQTLYYLEVIYLAWKLSQENNNSEFP